MDTIEEANQDKWIKALINDPSHKENPLMLPLKDLYQREKKSKAKLKRLLEISDAYGNLHMELLMKNYILSIEGTTTTPKIFCDAVKGEIFMEGDSYPENSFEFFKDFLAWVEDYLSKLTAPLELELRLAYLNTSSVKILMDIFDMLEVEHFKKRKVSVKWFYDNRNERLVALAEEFKEDCSFPFLIIASD